MIRTSPTSPYPIRFTDLAVAFARRNSTLEQTETLVRGEIVDLGKMGLVSIESLMMHCIETDWGTDLIATPDGNGGILVDTASVEEGEMLHEGPFAGTRIQFPKPDSQR